MRRPSAGPHRLPGPNERTRDTRRGGCDRAGYPLRPMPSEKALPELPTTAKERAFVRWSRPRKRTRPGARRERREHLSPGSTSWTPPGGYRSGSACLALRMNSRTRRRSPCPMARVMSSISMARTRPEGGPKPPSPPEVTPDYDAGVGKVTAGVDLGGTKIQTVLLNDRKVVGRARVLTPQAGAADVISTIAQTV